MRSKNLNIPTGKKFYERTVEHSENLLRETIETAVNDAYRKGYGWVYFAAFPNVDIERLKEMVEPLGYTVDILYNHGNGTTELTIEPAEINKEIE